MSCEVWCYRALANACAPGRCESTIYVPQAVIDEMEADLQRPAKVNEKLLALLLAQGNRYRSET